MKKIITIILAAALLLTMVSCSSGKSLKYNLNGHEIIIADYGKYEDQFKAEMAKKGYKDIKIYDTELITPEIIENRKNSNNTIVERIIGVVTDADAEGDGVVLFHGKSDEYNYISYAGLEDTQLGTIVLTYCLYNPETNYIDDILERYDYIIDRNFED